MATARPACRRSGVLLTVGPPASGRGWSAPTAGRRSRRCPSAFLDRPSSGRPTPRCRAAAPTPPASGARAPRAPAPPRGCSSGAASGARLLPSTPLVATPPLRRLGPRPSEPAFGPIGTRPRPSCSSWPSWRLACSSRRAPCDGSGGHAGARPWRASTRPLATAPRRAARPARPGRRADRRKQGRRQAARQRRPGGGATRRWSGGAPRQPAPQGMRRPRLSRTSLAAPSRHSPRRWCELAMPLSSRSPARALPAQSRR
mmetsp:Transcript_58723/g.157321  ORF Transcript_58723/g.157321 Transcript_58723/m.157321 type:complete len:258 (-) Transcript_58723:60-833(-)